MKNSGLFLNVGKNDDTKEAYFGIDFRKTGEKDVKPTIKPKITNIDSDGPSHDVLKEKDLILELNKKKVKNVKDFFNIRKKLKPGELVYVRVKRRRQELTRVIRIISLHEFKNPKQKHRVRLDIYFNEKAKDLKIIAVQKKSISYNNEVYKRTKNIKSNIIGWIPQDPRNFLNPFWKINRFFKESFL